MASDPTRRRAERRAALAPADLHDEVQGARLALTGAVERLKKAGPGARPRSIRRAIVLYLGLRQANDAAQARLDAAGPEAGTAAGP